MRRPGFEFPEFPQGTSPGLLAWKASVLPLDDRRINYFKELIRLDKYKSKNFSKIFRVSSFLAFSKK